MDSFKVPPDQPQQDDGPKCFDDDGRIKRTGTVWTASAHIVTGQIGPGVLPLAWAIGRLGWIAGPAVMLLFSFVTFYASVLLAASYRSGNPDIGERSYTYMDAVRANLGQLANQTAFTRMVTIVPATRVAIHTEIVLSQIQDFDKLWWLPIVAAVMSFTYSTIGVALGTTKVAENGKLQGSLTGISIGAVTQTQKIWRSFQALGDIAFAYSYSTILIEIQDTIKSPPSEAKTMRKAMLVSLAVMTLFYLLAGCMVYGAFGDMAPGHLLAGFRFFDPYWLIDVANAAIVIHLIVAYQVYSLPFFTFVEKFAMRRFADSQFITKQILIRVPGFRTYNLYVSRLILRTIFVIITTVISMLLPFFNEMVGLVGALGFWPLTVYFPVEMYIAQMKIPKWSTKWLCLQILSVACLIISIAVAAGSIAGIVLRFKSYKPIGTSY